MAFDPRKREGGLRFLYLSLQSTVTHGDVTRARSPNLEFSRSRVFCSETRCNHPSTPNAHKNMSRPEQVATPTRPSKIPLLAQSFAVTPSATRLQPMPTFNAIDTPSRTIHYPMFKQPQSAFKPVPSTSAPERRPFFEDYDPGKEPIKAYLRIRPPPENLGMAHSTPYITVASDTEVVMTPPEHSNAFKTRNRASERYRFTRVFSERATQNAVSDENTQKAFFDETTLPLVREALEGRDSLLFAYGVTNSGKTYSIQGKSGGGGLLPRTLNVIFNSIEGKQSAAKIRPVRYNEVETDETDDIMSADIRFFTSQKEARATDETHASVDDHERKGLVLDFDDTLVPTTGDLTVVPIDQHYEYAVWVSYAEIYKERIFDLLENPVRGMRRRMLALKNDRSTGNMYVAGLKEMRIRNMQNAYAILTKGQKNRAMFSTKMNHTSSRSHGIFTIKIVRYAIEDSACVTVSRLSIVDLAGSERTKNTQSTGERLNEACKINKSLMVLGQCMETLRQNQKGAKKKPALVPFRHSKLTEILKRSFVNDGKTVMIVCVNPFDTGFDENSQVMKFSAVAKDVMTVQQVSARVDHGQLRRLGVRSMDAQAGQLPQAKLGDAGVDVDVENEDEYDDESMSNEDADDEAEEGMDEVDEEDCEDPFVNDLLAQLHEVKEKWVEAESRCATIEAEVREQVLREMTEQLNVIEATHRSALERELEAQNGDYAARVFELEELLEKERLERRALASKLTDMERDQFKDRLNCEQPLQEHTDEDSALEKSTESPITNEVDHEPNEAMHREIVTAEDAEAGTDEVELIEEPGAQKVDEDLAVVGLCEEPHVTAGEVEPKKKPIAPETNNEIPVVELYKGAHTVQVVDVKDDISDDVESNEKLAPEVVPAAEDQATTEVDENILVAEERSTTEEQRSPSRLSLRADRSASELSSGSEPAESLDEEYQSRVRKFWILRHELQRQVLGESIEDREKVLALFTEIEEFKGVDFEMVKESKMGKLLKLIVTQQEANGDLCGIKERAKRLFKLYAGMKAPAVSPGDAESEGLAVTAVENAIPIAPEIVRALCDALENQRGQNQQLSVQNEELVERMAKVEERCSRLSELIEGGRLSVAWDDLGLAKDGGSKLERPREVEVKRRPSAAEVKRKPSATERAERAEKRNTVSLDNKGNNAPVQQKAQKRERTSNTRRVRKKAGSKFEDEDEDDAAGENDDEEMKAKDGKKKKRKLRDKKALFEEDVEEIQQNILSPINNIKMFKYSRNQKL
ncbi:kinesin motor domain-containing protein [Endogone sp. FLAS-F59071]|nr:kinesin motor domain-containing protein [Endogone sp. FLAS-F59071]|eukprot:RUS16811.1 kinesin motor domain-containing protein [Endogone sp. FLAS-F59071]